MLTIIDPQTTQQFDDVRELCWEYREFLLKLDPVHRKIVRAVYPVDKYTRLMDSLKADHAPPDGTIKLALNDHKPVGCAMRHTLSPGVAEIKRVFVRNSARGLGAGRALMQAVIDQSRIDGFSRILMDTGEPLKAAQNLYLSMGFRLRDAYQELPDVAKDRLIFFEMEL